MPFTRVKDKDTGHEFSVINVDPDVHEVLDKPGQDEFGRQLPAKHNIHKGGTASAPNTESGKTKEAQK